MKKELLEQNIKEMKHTKTTEIIEAYVYYKSQEQYLGKEEKLYLEAIIKELENRNKEARKCTK